MRPTTISIRKPKPEPFIILPVSQPASNPMSHVEISFYWFLGGVSLIVLLETKINRRLPIVGQEFVVLASFRPLH
jgi:hypothetical protein